MGLLDRNPVLKRAIVNQYQAILAAGAVGFSVLLANPLPLILFAGGQLMVMPFLLERLKRRMEIERKASARQFEEMTGEQRYGELPGPMRQRFERLRQLCGQIQENYRGLSPASQGVLADQTAKFDAILANALRRFWLLQKYEELARTFSPRQVKDEVGKIKLALESPTLDARVREAWRQNLAIKEKLLASVDRHQAQMQALAAELDSLETLLQLLLQKSLAATDAGAFALEIDDVVSQAEADAASVVELERMLGGIPELVEPADLGGLATPAPRDRARQGGLRWR